MKESEFQRSMKRQNSLLSSSSSSHVEISVDNLHRRSKSFGCISGILHFLSKDQTRRKKCITFVHNYQENDATSETKSPIRIPPSSQAEGAGNLQSDSSSNSSRQMLELQRCDSVISAENFRGARWSIVRLMGLESCTEVAVQPTAVAETTVEKQRQVMVALDKCEQDLKALKDFIDAFESGESFRSSAPTCVGKKAELTSGGSHRDFMFWEQHPSPVSVLDESSLRRHFFDVDGSHSIFSERPSANSGRTQSQPRQQMQRKKAGKGDIFNLSKFDRIKFHELVGIWKEEKQSESPLCSSRAMRESVEGVCKDSAWGQKREVGRIGVALQNQICGDLIEELVTDLKFGYTCNYTSLPFEACKRRLCF